MINYAVITSIVGTRALLRDDQDRTGADFVAFVDQKWNSKVWHERAAYDRFKSARLNSRVPKILSHLFLDAEYTLWMDGNVALRVPMDRLVAEWLRDADIAAFSHHCRRCTYDEAEECQRRRLADPQVIADQVRHYQEDGLEKDRGLAECTVVLRKNTRAVAAFNQIWWAEYTRYSPRDQISFMYAAKTAEIRLNLMTPSKLVHPYFDIIPTSAEPEAY